MGLWKNSFSHGEENALTVVASAFKVSSLFQQVAVLVLHMEVLLIPPRGLPT